MKRSASDGMDDDDRVDVRGHGRVVEEHVVGVGVLVGAGRRVVPEGQGEGQQSPLATAARGC